MLIDLTSRIPNEPRGPELQGVPAARSSPLKWTQGGCVSRWSEKNGGVKERNIEVRINQKYSTLIFILSTFEDIDSKRSTTVLVRDWNSSVSGMGGV